MIIDITMEDLVQAVTEMNYDEVMAFMKSLELQVGDWSFTREIVNWGRELEYQFRREMPEYNAELFFNFGDFEEASDGD